MRRSVFITGGSGLLALNWALAIRNQHRVTLGLHARKVAVCEVESHQAGLDTEEDVLRAFDLIQPQIVVHTAGLTNVERCEADPSLAELTNVGLAVNVAKACARHGVSLVHVSTDHLFSGDTEFVPETEPVAPKNIYAATKARAEVKVLETHPTAMVVRTNFYGWGPGYRPSFSDMIIGSLRLGRGVNLFSDVFFTPILIDALVRAVHDLIAVKAQGIVHVVGDERMSKYDFGIALAKEFKLDPSLIRAGSISDLPFLVRRPRDMSLSNAKASRLLGRSLGGMTQQFPELCRQEKCGLIREIQNL